MMADFLNQWRGNARLRWGIALVVGIAWLYGILLLRDELQDRNMRLRSSSQAVARLQTQLEQPEWTERAIAARALATQLESRLWLAPTTGLAQSTFQDWLTQNAAKAGITSPQVTVTLVEDNAPAVGAQAAPTQATAGEKNASTPTDLWKLKARLAFDFSPPTFMDLLARMENNDKQIVVKVVTVRKEPNPRAELEVYAYFQKPRNAASNASTPAATKDTGGR